MQDRLQKCGVEVACVPYDYEAKKSIGFACLLFLHGVVGMMHT